VDGEIGEWQAGIAAVSTRSWQDLPHSHTAFGNPSLYFWTPLLNGLHAQRQKGREIPKKGVLQSELLKHHAERRMQAAGRRTMRVMK